ncbi:hypothetical protein ACTXT7_011773 [Hymenolepis weldensis]
MIVDIFTALAVFTMILMPATLPLSILIILTRWNFGNEQFRESESEKILKQDKGVNTDFEYLEKNGVDNFTKVLKLHNSIRRMLQEYIILMSTALVNRNEGTEIVTPVPPSRAPFPPPPPPLPLSWRPQYHTNKRDVETHTEVSTASSPFADVIKELKGKKYKLKSISDRNETRSVGNDRELQEEEYQAEREPNTI